MTIDEAIKQHEKLSQVKSELALKATNEVLRNHAVEADKKRSEEHLQYVAWLTELKKLREETAELKRLLRLAVEEITKQKLYADLGMMSRGTLCKSCKTRSITNRVCQVCSYEYEHAEEALKLIGGDK